MGHPSGWPMLFLEPTWPPVKFCGETRILFRKEAAGMKRATRRGERVAQGFSGQGKEGEVGGGNAAQCPRQDSDPEQSMGREDRDLQRLFRIRCCRPGSPPKLSGGAACWRRDHRAVVSA
jgi:hypothetical protein